jgi:ribosome-associated heat shock protein Hsp15
VSGRIRIDKWLWHARFAKTRALAQGAATSGLIRLNNARVVKSSAEVGPGDILTIPRGREIVVVRIEACGIRRGPAKEAQALYAVLDEETLDRADAAP